MKKTAWIPKTFDLKEILHNPKGDPQLLLDHAYINQGTAADWKKEDWPPRKIEIHIKEVR